MPNRRTLLICSCEDTMPLAAAAFERGCRGADIVSGRQLCRAELERVRSLMATGAPLTTLLVTGGAGAVGHYAVQLATWAGARVIATVSSPEKAERARAGGAAHVINYRQEDVAARVLDITGGVGVDHIAEVDFGGNLAAALRCLRVNGSIMIYATNGDREPKVPVRDLMQKNLAVYAMSLAGVPHSDRRRAQSDIAAWTATPGRILSVAARFPLLETAGAHKEVERGGKVGTVIVEPQR